MYAMINEAQGHHRQLAIELQAAARLSRRSGEQPAKPHQSARRASGLSAIITFLDRANHRPARAR